MSLSILPSVAFVAHAQELRNERGGFVLHLRGVALHLRGVALRLCGAPQMRHGFVQADDQFGVGRSGYPFQLQRHVRGVLHGR